MSKIKSGARGARIAAAAGVCAVAVLAGTAIPASASTDSARPAVKGSARAYAPDVKFHTVGPFNSQVDCDVVLGAFEAAAPPGTFVSDCFEFGTEWFFEWAQ